MTGLNPSSDALTLKKDTPWTRPKPITSISPHTLGRVSEVMILDDQCGVLVHKRCLQNIPYRTAQKVFARNMKTVGQKSLNPYFRDEDIDFFFLSKNDIYLVAAHQSPDTADTAISVLIYLDFLHRLYEVLKDCIGSLNEPYIAANRMLVFEILDEMTSCGYGLMSSYLEVKGHLTLEPIRPKIVQPDDLASRFFGIYIADKTWNQSGSSKVKHNTPNSVYLNIVEGISAVFGPNGEICSSELWGKLTLVSTQVKPSPILIYLNRDLIIRSSVAKEGQVAGATHIENPSFHPCVDVSDLARKQLLKVFPPPDQTRLMTYTLSDSACIQIPVIAIPSLVTVEGSRDQNLTLRLINQAESHAKASYIRVKVKLPQSVTSISTTKHGDQDSQNSQFVASEKTVEWEVKRSHGGSEAMITFRLICSSDKIFSLADVGPIAISFNMINFSASGLFVQEARVVGHAESVSNTNLPEYFFGVSTKAASYIVRTDTTSEQTFS